MPRARRPKTRSSNHPEASEPLTAKEAAVTKTPHDARKNRQDVEREMRNTKAALKRPLDLTEENYLLGKLARLEVEYREAKAAEAATAGARS